MTSILMLLMLASPSPQDDFYEHVNQSWLQQTSIPADRSRWGAFDELDKNVQATLQRLAEDAAAHPTDALHAQVGRFYQAGMDTAGIEAAGLAPLQPWLDGIAAVQDARSLAVAVASLHRIGVNALFDFGAAPDAKDSNNVIGQLPQAGLGLPDRDYYFSTDAAPLRDAYAAHVGRMLLMADLQDAATRTADVLQLETELANASLTAVQRRDPVATYNKWTLADLQRQAPGFAWDVYADASGIPAATPINVESPAFVTRVGALATQTPWPVLRAYLTWQLVHRAAPFLGDAWVQENFAFYGKTLTGTPAMQPRAQRVIGALDRSLGEALGQLYVAEALQSGTKAAVLELVGHVRDALADRLQTLAWMGPATRAKALQKLAKISVKIGYPDAWVDYSSVAVDGVYASNVLRAASFNTDRVLQRLNKPVDRSLWEMTPQTVNAYYNPQTNEIVFPAAILQPPFYDAQADLPSNYGGIGGVIGHELTHGYDDQGRQFDADGNMQDWWTADDAARFDAQRAQIVKQFDAYSFFDKPVNGSLTQGENIADLGGVKVALTALRAALQATPETGVQAAESSAEQRFFKAWARVWRNHVRQEAAHKRLLDDPHSPGVWRVNGPLSNMPDFYAAFGVQEGDGMYRADAERVTIW